MSSEWREEGLAQIHRRPVSRRVPFLRNWLVGLISRAETGSLSLVFPDGQAVTATGTRPGPDARFRIRRWRGLLRYALGGQTGFAEAYMSGDVECSDLTALFAWTLANEAALGSSLFGVSASRLLARLQHGLHGNTRRGSRRNIAAHYDLGNAFYGAWLDEGMNYSSALYRRPGATLEEAQEAKIDRIIDALALRGGERVLEIGCGWGALSERLATRHGCAVMAITLSHEQLSHARHRIREAGAADRVEVRLQDYRDVEGRYDRIVSIEMIEAVGVDYWPVYFAKLRDSLIPGGLAVLQAITISEATYTSYRSHPDFIQRYIFPGGMLPTAGILREEARRVSLTVTSDFAFGDSYVRTLVEWRERFQKAWPRLAALGFDERFRRMWDYYLCYCEAGFRAGILDVGLFQLR